MDEYKGIKVGIEINLGEHIPDSDILVTMILLEEVRSKNPKAYDIASKAIQEMYTK